MAGEPVIQTNTLADQAKINNLPADTTTQLGTKLAKASNLSDLASIPTAKLNLSLVKADVGLGNVDNTSDANKPVSIAQQTALDAKVDDTEKGDANGVATLDANTEVVELPAGAAAATPGYVLQQDGSWVAQSGGGFTPSYKISSNFGEANRFSFVTGGSGTGSLFSDGLSLTTNTTISSFARTLFSIDSTTRLNIFDGTTQFFGNFKIFMSSANGQSFFGAGFVNTTGSSIDFTKNHIGFKAVATAGFGWDLYATQGDGTTESATLLVSQADEQRSVSVAYVADSVTGSVDYYYRTHTAGDNGTWSSATTINTNYPLASEYRFEFGVSNVGTTAQANMAGTTFNFIQL